MLQFTATVVEVFTSEFDVFTVHFDDEGEHYLQLQAIPERDEDQESAGVYVEVDDQGIAGADCFSLVELRRASFRIVFAHEPALVQIGELVVLFDLDSAAFAELRSGLARVFAGVPEYQVADSEGR